MARYKLGRTAPHPAETHPRLRLGDFLASYPPAPAVVDYIGKVADWPMFKNDELGDCTCAGIAHMLEAWTTYGSGKTVEVTDADVVKLYEAVGGYVPGDPSTDQGANMQDVLTFMRKTGMAGHKILAFASVDVGNTAELEAAMALFGHVYVGVNLPAIAQDQFSNGQPWDVVADDGGIEGGHAITWGYAAKGADHKVITWGAVQQATPAWFARYVEEAWVVVSQDFVDAAGDNPEGLDTAAMGAAFTAMTGEPSPFRPSPQPVPGPSPRPVPPADPDAALVAALTPWLATRHEGANAKAAAAVRTWMAAKNL
jgi:hypothetical protein